MSFSIMRPFTDGAACAKIRNGSREISIAADDSCGKLPDYGQSDIRLYLNDKDVTDVVWPGNSLVPATLSNLEKAISWLRAV